jgi:DNA ligase-1
MLTALCCAVLCFAGPAGVKVIFIDANHCPGAAQILFELPNGRRYIHCGDMRYSPRMLDNPHLRRFKNADAVFLDTTYAHPKHCFPAQVSCELMLCQAQSSS